MIPRRLRRGDAIGIVSPSNPVTDEHASQLEKGIHVLQNLGLHVRLGEHLRCNTLGFSATPLEKAADINAFFSDDSIQAVMCSQGGDTANGCLECLDWETIGKNPKVFIGISDVTVLLNAINTKTDMVTFHGNDLLWGLGRVPTEYDLSEFQRRLFGGEMGPVPPVGERTTIRRGKSEGRLWGGNLRCLLKLSGTPYFPNLKNSMLFLEALDISPAGCHAAFHQMRQMGVFRNVNGVVVGYVDGLKGKPRQFQMESILLEVTADMDFPILKVNDFGHNCPNAVLPIGARARVDADAMSVESLEPFVQ